MKSIIVQAPSGFEVPVGSVILWYGVIANVPIGWQILTDLMGYFPRGATAWSSTAKGAATHNHGYTNKVETKANHQHSMNQGTVGGTISAQNGTSGSYQVANNSHQHNVNASNDAAGGHTHTIANTGAASSIPKSKKLYYIKKVS